MSPWAREATPAIVMAAAVAAAAAVTAAAAVAAVAAVAVDTLATFTRVKGFPKL